ncbi:MAG: biotin/lipoyl-binding carrier protein [Actinomycetota bacterium]|nr:biotin/lipoyl-binding carrier protein [Actinomycetota bacterium]
MAEKVQADLGANVWKIVVAVGDTLEPGEPIMILESMKMEIPVIAEDGGIVSSLEVGEGDTVEEGQVLAVLGVVPPDVVDGGGASS